MSDNAIRLRDYQLDALANVFRAFNIEPAGPSEDAVVAYCRSNRTRQDGEDGSTGKPLAEGSGDDVVAPF